MKFKRNQIVRIVSVGANMELPVRYWGRLARVSMFVDGFVLVKPRNRKGLLAVLKTEIMER